MIKQAGVVIVSFSLMLVVAPVAAQHNDGNVSETVATTPQRDVNVAERVSEKVVTLSAQTGDGEEVVIETYGPSMYEGRVELTQRVRRVTTVTAHGSRTVEETEEHPLGSRHEPMRIVRRSVTTVHRSGTDGYVTERRVFERDGNGRLVLTETEIERSSRR